jgi:hypothetical protein
VVLKSLRADSDAGGMRSTVSPPPLRKLLRVSLLVVALMTVLMAPASPAAAPVPGARPGSLVWPNSLAYLDTSLCPQSERMTATAFLPRLSAVVSGSFGPVYGSFFQRVSLRAEVSGTITDSEGNRYRAVGQFAERGVYSLLTRDLRFDGAGTLVLTGPGGVIAGEATLKAVTAPNELQLTYTRIATCHFR